MLFRSGEFKLSSGGISRWKIECDNLDVEDWTLLAMMIAEHSSSFGAVVGIPRGGLALATALVPHITTGPRLLVDDVWTTGGTIAKWRQPNDVVWVAFARSQPTDGTRAVFTLTA